MVKRYFPAKLKSQRIVPQSGGMDDCMGFISELIGWPLGWVMWLGYQVLRNYGFALIFFTFVTKMIMFPLTLKQQKSSVKMALIKPKLDNIQKKYANNKEKLNEEMMKLYQEEGYNPMSGCLPLLIQFPILFGLINVVYNPLTHIIRLSKEVIEQGLEIARGMEDILVNVSMPQISIIQGVKAQPELFSSLLSPEQIQRISNFNMSFLGIDLTAVPTLALNTLLIIPILSGVTSFLISIQSMRQTETTAGENGNTMKGMMDIMPLFSLFFCFLVPAGVGLYWGISNVLSYLQSMYMNKKYNPQEMAEKARAEQAALEEAERQQRLENRKKARQEMAEYQAEVDAAEQAAKGKKKKNVEIEVPKAPDEETIKKGMTAKEINRMKLAAARKRDAEKYGEEYVEVTDDDLR